MATIDLDRLPEFVRAGTVSVKQAVNALAEFIHTHPEKFGLYKFDEDFKSDIIIRFLQQAHVLFARYDREIGEFMPYIYSFVRGMILSQLRDLHKNDEIVKSVRSDEENDWEYKINRYTPESYVAENHAACAPRGKCFFRRPVDGYCAKKRTKTEKTAIVLALKSSYFLSDRHISLVSDYCGVSKKGLESTVSALNKSLEKRARQRDVLRARRDNAYYFHRKYAAMMQKDTAENGGAPDAGLAARYKMQTLNWQSKNAQLRKTGYRLCPTNKTVARVLGICERQVHYYMASARRKMKEKEGGT